MVWVLSLKQIDGENFESYPLRGGLGHLDSHIGLAINTCFLTIFTFFRVLLIKCDHSRCFPSPRYIFVFCYHFCRQKLNRPISKERGLNQIPAKRKFDSNNSYSSLLIGKYKMDVNITENLCSNVVD